MRRSTHLAKIKTVQQGTGLCVLPSVPTENASLRAFMTKVSNFGSRQILNLTNVSGFSETLSEFYLVSDLLNIDLIIFYFQICPNLAQNIEVRNILLSTTFLEISSKLC